MKKVAITCGAKSTNQLAPFDDLDCEIWVLGNQADQFIGKRVSRIFEIHDHIGQHPKEYPEWLAAFDVPIVVGNNGIEGEPFPYAECRNMIGFEYFTSSPACMLAYAILKGYDDISIYGVDMAMDDHEYFMQRPVMEGWIGFALGKGIKITIPERSSLCKWTYNEGRDWPAKGYKTSAEDCNKMIKCHKESMSKIKKELDSLSGIEQRITQLKATYQAHDGARQVYDRLHKLERAKGSGIPVDIKEGVVNG